MKRTSASWLQLLKLQPKGPRRCSLRALSTASDFVPRARSKPNLSENHLIMMLLMRD